MRGFRYVCDGQRGAVNLAGLTLTRGFWDLSVGIFVVKGVASDAGL